MTQAAAPPHPLVERLTRLRARVRLVLALFGAGILVATAVGSLFLLIAGDYLLHFSAALRIVLLLAWITVLAILAWRFLMAPLMTRLTDQFLASRVENVHAGLSDEIMSAVQFIHAGTPRTNAFAARHVDSAMRKTATMRFEEAIDFRNSVKALGIAALIAIGVAIVASLNPQLSRIGFSRWFSAAPLDWPRITHVAFAWDTPDGRAPAVLPIGEQVLVRAKVLQGGYANQRVWLTNWSNQRRAADDLMTFQPGMSGKNEFVYERTLDPGGDKSLSLRLAAGDDAEQEPVTIRLAPRPLIAEIFASITPPAYVKNVTDPTKPAPAVVVDLLTQAGHAVEGATLALRIKSTKPFMTNAEGEPDIRLLDENKDEELPLPPTATRTLLNPTLAEFTFPAVKTLQARLAMRDVDGFDNRVGGTLTLEVVPDNLPSVVITEPRRTAERAPTANVQVSIQATDDLGLEGLKLIAEKFDAKPGEAPLFEQPLTWTERTVDPASGNTTGRADFAWNLAPLHLTAGTRLSFYAMVRDNYEMAGKRHPWVKSPALTLQIRSEAEIADAARKQLNEIKERIKGVRVQQDQTRAQTQVIQQAAAAAGVTTAQQKAQLADLAQQQNEEAASANAIQQSVEQVRSDLQQNNMAQSDLGKLSADVSNGMKEVAGKSMPAAASDLSKAHDAAGNSEKQNAESRKQAKETADAATSAVAEQASAIARMDALIDQLGAAGDFEAVRSELRKIQEKQEALSTQARELSTQTVGRTLEQLTKEMRDKLNDAAKNQKDLSNQTNDLIDKMNKTATQLSQSDPAASESLKNASQIGQEEQVTPSQMSASGFLAANQTNNASDSQSQAQRGLQKMTDELDKNDQRQLEQLARDLQELIDQVKGLRDGEVALHKDSMTAGASAPEAAMTKLGDRQGQLQMNAIVIQKKAENTKNAQSAAVDIHEAAGHMTESASALYGNHQAAALDPETQAIASLNAALKKLEQEKQKVDDQVKDKDLAYFIKQYEGIGTDQKGVKDAADAIESRRQAAVDKQINRIDSSKLITLAITQGSLVDRINKLSADDKLKDFPVVLWMNTQITESMNISGDRLKQSETGVALAAAQQNAIDRIQDIVDALKEEKQRKSEFKQDDQGGGGGGGGGKQPLVPPLAQLKLLKAMQIVINDQTTSVGKSISAAPDDASRAELQGQAENLSKKQGEIKNIAHTIVDKLQQQ